MTPKEKAFFDENGYLVIDNFASKEQMQQLRQAMDRIVEKFDENEHRSIFQTGPNKQQGDEYFLTSGDKIRCFFEPGAFELKDGKMKTPKHLSINKVGHDLHGLDPAFRAFSFSPAVSQLIYSLPYEQAAVCQSMYIFKQPRIGEPVDAHQDSTFLYTIPQSVTGLWWAVEDATKQNGCLWAVPGSHRLGNKSCFRRRKDGKPGTEFDPPKHELSVEGAVPLEMPSGSVVVIHGDLVHLSHPNTSEKSRHAYSIHIIETGKGVQYPAHNWLQRSDSKPFPVLPKPSA